MTGKLTDEYPVALRLPTSVLRRADSLRTKLSRDPEFTAYGKISRSFVLRLALIRGLEVLEAKYR